MTKEVFNTKAELFSYLIKNKSLIISERKTKLKVCDTFKYSQIETQYKDKATKGFTLEIPTEQEVEEIIVKSVINTTNIMDSHHDVHIKGIWNKSLKENKNIYLLQEHDLSFKGVIAENVIASVSEMDWKDLGFDGDGMTQALIFESKICEDRNEFMFEQYLNGYVKNHSVGMQYVTLYLCINDKEYKEEFANWNKYISEVINRVDAEENGYFWAVTEAKIVEGSAVVIGSNPITPTLQIIEINEPEESTLNDKTKPEVSTLQKENVINSINNFKFV